MGCSVEHKLNAPRPSEHPPVRGKSVKTFRWDHRLQIQNFFMAFKRVPLYDIIGLARTLRFRYITVIDFDIDGHNKSGRAKKRRH